MGNKNIVDAILDNLKTGGGYYELDDYIMNNTNDVKALYYSCVLYEQAKKTETAKIKDEKIKEHILFWQKEKCEETQYKAFINDMKKLDFHCHGKGVEITLGCSTVCNAKCSNCTHETMVRNGELLPKILELKELRYWVRKYKLLSLVADIQVTSISPVGMGEPLTNPNIIEFYKYIKIFFPNAELGLNTNISLLKGNMAHEIAKLNMGYIYLSLSYFNKETYEREVGLDYDNTVKNILDFIRICEEENSKTRITIHILNNELNSKKDIKEFIKYFQPLLHKKDRLEIRRYMQISGKSIKGRGIKRKKLRPCYELWQVLATEANGNIYPCCLGLWKKYDPYLSIGNITDPIPDIIRNLMNIRERQFNGDFNSCMECDVLQHNRAFFLPIRFYNKEKTIKGDIQYITQKKFLSEILYMAEKIKCYILDYSKEQSYWGTKDK